MATATKAQPTRKAIQTKVVNMRDKQQKSWAEIGEAVEAAPRTVRRMYDEVKGAGAHHGLLPGKGGRTPVEAKAAPKAKATTKPAAKKAAPAKAAAKAPAKKAPAKKAA